MAKPYDPHNHEVFQEHLMVEELLATLPEIDDTLRIERRFYKIIAPASHIEI